MSNPFESPQTVSAMPEPGVRVLRRIHMVRAGVVCGALGALGSLGVVAVVFLLAVGGLGNLVGAASLAEAGMLLVFAPIIYGIMFFLNGVLFAAFYNIIASFTGGLKFNVE